MARHDNIKFMWYNHPFLNKNRLCSNGLWRGLAGFCSFAMRAKKLIDFIMMEIKIKDHKKVDLM